MTRAEWEGVGTIGQVRQWPHRKRASVGQVWEGYSRETTSGGTNRLSGATRRFNPPTTAQAR